jgi:hypothetical protein
VAIIKNQDIEDLAHARLAEFQRVMGCPLSIPIPIDLVAEKVLGLDFLWDTIEELPGETILGGLNSKERLIVLNEKRRDLFSQKPGLERSTKGHEMGHWDLFVDKGTLDHPALLHSESGCPFAFRRSPKGDVAIIKLLSQNPEGWALLRQLRSRLDEPDEARAVNRYAAVLSMPVDLLRAEAMKTDRMKWPNLYRLAEKFDVTISALTIRLEQLGLIFVDEDKKIYESRSAAMGQTTLGF